MSFGFPFEVIKEGAVKVAVPKLDAFKKAPWEYAPSKAPVFYNPAMKQNRDLAVLVGQAFQKSLGREISIAEPLAGCGVRGVRFAAEIEGVQHVYLNDLNPIAYRMAKHNVRINHLEGRVSLSNEDANLFMSRYAAPHKRFDFIDVDPFGSPVPFLDSAVRALKDGGLLALTATDMAPLCGVHPKAAFRKYGGFPLRTEYCHELAVRLLIGALVMTAAKHEIGVKILLGYKSGHYVRLYASLAHGAKKADASIEKIGYILHCFNCFQREASLGLNPFLNGKCPACGGSLKVAGPLWLGELVDRNFCERVEKESFIHKIELDSEIKRMLSLIKRESDAPATYFVIDKICDKLGLPSPPVEKVIERLDDEGFKVWPTHFNSRGIKTDAPAKAIIEAVKSLS